MSNAPSAPISNGKGFAYKRFAILLVLLLASRTVYATACKSETKRFISDGGGCLDVQTGIIWGDASNAGTNYENAAIQCAKNKGRPEDGWRLPTGTELRVVAQKIAFENFDWQRPNQFFWTFTEAGVSDALMIMPTPDSKPADEAFQDVDSSAAAYVCVRRGFGCFSRPGEFQTADGGCRQASKKIIWSNISKGDLNHTGMKNYCSTEFRQGGFEDWQLPSEGELSDLNKSGILSLFGPDFNELLWTQDEKYDTKYGSGYVYSVMFNPKSKKSKLSHYKYKGDKSAWEWLAKEKAFVVCVRRPPPVVP